MAHIELILLSKIIRTGDLGYVLEWGMQEEDFRTTEGRGLFTHLLGYHQSLETHGSVPGVNMYRHLYPSFELCDDVNMSLDALCHEVRKARISGELKSVLAESVESIDLDPVQTTAILAEKIRLIQSLGMKTIDSPLSKAAPDLLRRYHERKTGAAFRNYISWPWAPLNDASGGISEDDYIVLYGRPKSKKSFVLGEILAHCYDQGKRALVYTKEMPAWQLHQRVMGFVGRLPYDELRLGRLTPDDERALNNVHDMIVEEALASQGLHDIIIISGKDAPAGQDSIGWLESKVEKYRPDIVFIDGMYLMASDKKTAKDEERVRYVSRACRQMVLSTGIPVCATVQANRASAKHNRAELDEIGYSDAIGQDATAIIRVINEKSNTPPTCALAIGDNAREFNMYGIRIWAQPCTNFSFKEILSEKEVENAKKNDAPEDDKPAAAVKPITRTPVNGKSNGSNGVSPTKLLNEQLKSV